MNEYQDFESEFKEKYGEEEFLEVNNLIDGVLDSDTSLYEIDKTWTVSSSIEKIHSLQYTYYINLSKETESGDDEEVNLTFENGINNGTQLLEYSLEGSCDIPNTHEVEVLVDIEIDWSHPSYSGKKIRKNVVDAIFKYHKDKILEIYGKQSYDNYVTGGGTGLTDKHYKDSLEKYHGLGLYWSKIYKTIEADRAFV